MFLTYICEAHGEFEMRGGNTPCPTCSVDMKRVYQPPTVHKQFDRRGDGNIPHYAGRPRIIEDRQGGGKVSIQSDVGGYRPMVTHTARCPNENAMRNVAVLAEFAYGTRLNCECGYQWIHNAATASDPLVEGVEESFRPKHYFFMNPDDPRPTQYTDPERGA